MALTDTEQQLFDFALGALPPWMPRSDAFLTACAKVFGSVRDLAEYLFTQALIGTAEGPTGTTPDWLAQHARDRATTRQQEETDEQLRARLREFPDALTRSVLIETARLILDVAGEPTGVAMVELPRDVARPGDYVALSGTGGTFAKDGTIVSFTPTDLPWLCPPFGDGALSPYRPWQLVISGAAHTGNNGARVVEGLADDAVLVTNAAGVAGADPSVTWTAQRLDGAYNVTDGFARAYVGRGYRIHGTRPATIVMILPYGSSEGSERSVRASLAFKIAAGFRLIIERRINP